MRWWIWWMIFQHYSPQVSFFFSIEKIAIRVHFHRNANLLAVAVSCAFCCRSLSWCVCRWLACHKLDFLSNVQFSFEINLLFRLRRARGLIWLLFYVTLCLIWLCLFCSNCFQAWAFSFEWIESKTSDSLNVLQKRSSSLIQFLTTWIGLRLSLELDFHGLICSQFPSLLVVT